MIYGAILACEVSFWLFLGAGLFALTPWGVAAWGSCS